MAAAQSVVTLMEEREEEVMTPWGGKPTPAKARFLLPSLNAEEAAPTAMIPPADQAGLSSSRNDLPHEASNSGHLPLDLSLEGWRNPTKRWEQWVSQMRPLYQPLWEIAGIAGAIESSVCTIVQHKDMILELAERWCSDTKSFIFPWGEATITLEDVAVIGGYSLGDECVRKPLETAALKDIEHRLIIGRLEIQRTRAARACQMLWMSKFMDNGSDLEHEAFLCFWLSRFVFPGPANGTIRKNVLPIAIHLSRGTKIALAPAVLASIYRDLHLLKRRERHSMRKPSRSRPLQNKLTLWAPFQLVQVWIWERFERLRPRNLRTTQISEPRLCRWKSAKTEVIENLARVFDRSGKTFVWRPYTSPLHCQGFMSELYGKKFVRVMSTYLQKEALENFVRCIRISEMVGADHDCIEQYMPHRVAMQFGFSQDIPVSQIAREDETSDIAWKNYTRPIIDSIIYVPPRYSEPQVSTRYYTCWKRSISIRLVDSSTIKPEGPTTEGMIQPTVNRKRSLEGNLKTEESTSTDERMIQNDRPLPLAPTPSSTFLDAAPPLPLAPTPSSTFLDAAPRSRTLSLAPTPSRAFLNAPPRSRTLSLTPNLSRGRGRLLAPHSLALTPSPVPADAFFNPPPPPSRSHTFNLAPTPSHGCLLAPPGPVTLSFVPTPSLFQSHECFLSSPRPLAFSLPPPPTPSHGFLGAPPRALARSLAPIQSSAYLFAPPRAPSLSFASLTPPSQTHLLVPDVFAPTSSTFALIPVPAPPPPPPPPSTLAPSQPGPALMLTRDPFPPPGFSSRIILAVRRDSGGVIHLPFRPH